MKIQAVKILEELASSGVKFKSLNKALTIIYDNLNEIAKPILTKGFEKGRGLTKDSWEQSDWESFEELQSNIYL